MYLSYIDIPTLFSIEILEIAWISDVKLVLDIDKRHLEIPCKFECRYSKSINEEFVFYSVFSTKYVFTHNIKGVFHFSFVSGNSSIITHKEEFEIRKFC